MIGKSFHEDGNKDFFWFIYLSKFLTENWAFQLFVVLDNRMNDNTRPGTSDAIRNVIVEVALDGPHVSSEARHHLCRQTALAAALHLNKVAGLEARLSVPHVNVWLTLVAEEDARLVVGSQ